MYVIESWSPKNDIVAKMTLGDSKAFARSQNAMEVDFNEHISKYQIIYVLLWKSNQKILILFESY